MLVLHDELKDTAGAIKELKAVLDFLPDSPAAENNLAWIYATTDDPQFRKPAEALVLARRAAQSSPYPNSDFLDTLAEALATETHALDLNPENGELRSRLAHFREAAQLSTSPKP